MMTSLAEGDQAPKFSLATDEGAKISLKDFKGQRVVLYFYPKDDTPGCTTEAKDFTSAITKFKRLNAIVVGVSKDLLTTHQKFRSKHDLKVILASDPEGKTVESYGCWVEKTLYGRKFMGIERSTFLIGEDQKISRIWRKVRVPGHVQEVLDALKSE